MHLAPLTSAEQRVLGCLVEKRFTTPDQYPLSLNALRLACNQSTNRDPVTALDESAVRDAAHRLARYGLARLASGHTSRATKYRHLAHEALGLEDPDLALLCVLLLRGPQTPGELKGRTERMVAFASLAEVEEGLSRLGERGYARRIPRRPGQKEDRFEPLLGAGADIPAETPDVPAETPDVPAEMPHVPAETRNPSVSAGHVPAETPHVPANTSPPAPPRGSDDVLAPRVAALEDEVAALRAELRQLRELFD